MNKKLLDYILKIRVPLVIFTVLSSIALTYYLSRPYRDGVGYSPDQPIAFSHKLHAGEMKIDCEYCHTSVKKSRFASIPSVNICMNCHSVARKNKPEIIKLTEYYQSNKPIQWVRIHKVPDYAYFSHSSHINRNIPCNECHGDVEKMDKVKQVNSFTMGSCLDCHRNAVQRLSYIPDIKKGPEYCGACHR